MIAIGGLVEIVPLFYLKNTIEKVDGVRPYTPLELAGRNIYVREGCYLCHSQMIRPLRDEVERYGHYSLAAESMYDQPVPVGLQAHRSRSRPRRRQIFRRLAPRPSARSALGRAGLGHAGLFVACARPISTSATSREDLKVQALLGVPYTRGDDRQRRRRCGDAGDHRQPRRRRSRQALSESATRAISTAIRPASPKPTR